VAHKLVGANEKGAPIANQAHHALDDRHIRLRRLYRAQLRCANDLLESGESDLHGRGHVRGQARDGTRAGAVAVSRDIRQTGTRRLRRVAAVPEPHSQAHLIRRWLNVERRLVATYARDYLLIWNAIDAANTPAQRARLPARLHVLLHDPDPLKLKAGVYELRLAVPDCTGGG
jgi:hypothetical protein